MNKIASVFVVIGVFILTYILIWFVRLIFAFAGAWVGSLFGVEWYVGACAGFVSCLIIEAVCDFFDVFSRKRKKKGNQK